MKINGWLTYHYQMAKIKYNVLHRYLLGVMSAMAEENSAMVMSSNDNAIGSMAKASGAAANCAREKKENIGSG
jgi:hypothetical protein